MRFFKTFGDWLYHSAWDVLKKIEHLNQRQDSTLELMRQLASPEEDWDIDRYDDIVDLASFYRKLDWLRYARQWQLRLLRLGIVIADKFA